MRSEAVFSGDMRYRYWLSREWDADKPRIAWIMLNPSTADHEKNDPTVTRCEGFARRWGFGGYVVANLFAYRATDPRELLNTRNPTGLPENIDWLAAAMREPAVMLAWGANGGDWAHSFAGTIPKLRQGMPPALCLGVTNAGSPKHPLYLKGNTEPMIWRSYLELPQPWLVGQTMLDPLPVLNR